MSDDHSTPITPLTREQTEWANCLILDDLSDTADRVVSVLDFLAGIEAEGLTERGAYGLSLILDSLASTLRVAVSLE